MLQEEGHHLLETYHQEEGEEGMYSTILYVLKLFV